MTKHDGEPHQASVMTAWLRMIDQLRLTLVHSGEKPVEMIQTHISVVLLGQRLAIKFKKPVDFGFLDYTTLEKRRLACLAEVELNSRLCPDVYLGAVPVVERAGVLSLHGKGRVVDYAVLMKRLPEDRMLHRLVADNSVTEAIISRIADRLAEFHRGARRGRDVDPFGSLENIRGNWQENFEQVTPYIGRTISKHDFETIRSWINSWMDENQELLQNRVAGGFICDGHGDVRCESICVTDDSRDGLSIFDCIEFNDRFRCGDVAGEIAFLATDLDSRGRPDLGYFLAEEYSRLSGDPQLFSLLPFYRCYRAFVRGKVLSFRLDETEFSAAEHADAARRARRFFDLALRYAMPLSKPSVVAVMGLSGTGKTSLARAIAGELGWRVVSSDAVRSEIYGQKKRPAAFGQESYSREASRLTYATMVELAEKRLRADGGVILDATFLHADQRAAVREMARGNSANWRLIVCKAPPESVRTRMAERRARHDGLSDADWNVYLEQRRRFGSTPDTQDGSRLILDTRESLSASARAATHWLRASEHQQPPSKNKHYSPPDNTPLDEWSLAPELSKTK